MNIVICLNPFISHFIPTIALAKAFKKAGNTVIYLGFASMKSIVTKEGFEFWSISTCENLQLVKLQRKKAYYEMGVLYKKLHDEIQTLMTEKKVDLAMIGISRFLIYLLPAMTVKVKIVLYSLCAGNPAFQCRTPPITSYYILANKRYDSIICFIKWFERFIRKGMKPSLMYTRFFYPWNKLIRICKEQKIGWKFGIDGFFPNLPLISLGSKLFEFIEEEGICFTGIGVDIERNIYDTLDSIAFDKITSQKKPLIYCTLGTMSDRYQNTEVFIKAIISLFNKNLQWNLILSLGKLGTTIQSVNLTDNIWVVDFTSQLDILKYANLVITHGGYGTIKECIYFGVPMLVFPSSYDQHGNAARVHYHKIGINSSLLKKTMSQYIFKTKIKKINSNTIKDLIETLLSSDQYHINISQFQKQAMNLNELQCSVNFITNETKMRINE